MSNPVFYQTVLERKLSDDTQRLFESLLSRNERIDQLIDEYSGGPEPEVFDPLGVDPSPSAQIKALQKRLAMLARLIGDEDFFIQAARDSEKSALENANELADTKVEQKRKIAGAIIALRQENIRELKAFRKRA